MKARRRKKLYDFVSYRIVSRAVCRTNIIIKHCHVSIPLKFQRLCVIVQSHTDDFDSIQYDNWMIVCVTIVDSIMMDGHHHHHPYSSTVESRKSYDCVCRSRSYCFYVWKNSDSRCRFRNSTPWTTLLRVTSGVRRIFFKFFIRTSRWNGCIASAWSDNLYSPFLHRKCINHHVKGCLVQTFILHSISSVLLVNSSLLVLWFNPRLAPFTHIYYLYFLSHYSGEN